MSCFWSLSRHRLEIQMQIQMEVCELNRCDFLETRFIEYDSYDEFINSIKRKEMMDEKELPF